VALEEEGFARVSPDNNTWKREMRERAKNQQKKFYEFFEWHLCVAYV